MKNRIDKSKAAPADKTKRVECKVWSTVITEKEDQRIEKETDRLHLSTDAAGNMIVTFGLRVLSLLEDENTKFHPLVFKPAMMQRLANAATVERMTITEFIISTVEADLNRAEEDDTMIHPVDGRWFSRANGYYARESDSDAVNEKMERLENEGFVYLNAIRPERAAKLLALSTSKEEVEEAVAA
jgi:hypothetical protein